MNSPSAIESCGFSFLNRFISRCIKYSVGNERTTFLRILGFCVFEQIHFPLIYNRIACLSPKAARELARPTKKRQIREEAPPWGHENLPAQAKVNKRTALKQLYRFKRMRAYCTPSMAKSATMTERYEYTAPSKPTMRTSTTDARHTKTKAARYVRVACACLRSTVIT